jgi:hypothetical protein
MKKRISNLMLTLVRVKIFGLRNSRVGAGAASKFFPGAGAALKIMRLRNTDIEFKLGLKRIFVFIFSQNIFSKIYYNSGNFCKTLIFATILMKINIFCFVYEIFAIEKQFHCEKFSQNFTKIGLFSPKTGKCIFVSTLVQTFQCRIADYPISE